MEDLLDIVLRIGSICGALATITAFVALVMKPVREWIIAKIRKITHSDAEEKLNKETNELVKKWIKDNETWQKSIEDKLDQLRRTDIVQLRNTINTLYEENYESKSLSLRQKDMLIDTFDQYESEGGNHNAKQKFDEMMTWRVRM